MRNLTNKQARLVRQLYKEGWKQVEIADYFRISQTAVSFILNGKTYKKKAA